MNSRVFGYGTLRRGEPNAGLLSGVDYLGSYTTPARYTMYSFGAYPGVVAKGRSAIVGEVYNVSRRQVGPVNTNPIDWKIIQGSTRAS